MMRQYYAQRCRGGNNPLRVGVLAVGAVFYIQDENYVRSRHGEAAICRAPWIIEAFLNGMMHATRRDPGTGAWQSSYWSGRSDTAVVRSLRDGRRRTVAVHLLQLHEDRGLTRGFSGYPTLPDLRFHRSRSRPQRTVLLGPDWARKGIQTA